MIKKNHFQFMSELVSTGQVKDESKSEEAFWDTLLDEAEQPVAAPVAQDASEVNPAATGDALNPPESPPQPPPPMKEPMKESFIPITSSPPPLLSCNQTTSKSLITTTSLVIFSNMSSMPVRQPCWKKNIMTN